MRAHRIAAAVAAALTVALVVLGAAVRATDSGLSCPDWPTCYGHLVPLPGDIPAEAGYAYYQVMLEWVHRLIAGVILGPLVLLVGILALRAGREHAELRVLGILAILLLLVQAVLGGVTVLDRNSPWSVAVHLITASTLLTVLLGIALHRPAEEHGVRDRTVLGLAVATWLVGIVAFATAAVVAKTGTNLACSDWPLCEGRLWPDMADPQVHVHMMHRIWALFAVLMAVVFAVVARGRGHPAGRIATGAAASGIVAMLFAGWAILAEWPAWMQVVHQAIAVFYLAHVAAAGWMTWWRWQHRLVAPAAREARGVAGV
ncbi:Heme A synthase [bacterium HR39]|nr:Heme A synthase [bacterium HR39]